MQTVDSAALKYHDLLAHIHVLLKAGDGPSALKVLEQALYGKQHGNEVCIPDAWPWQVKIYTLGQFSVMLGDTPLETGSKAARKPLELLKALLAFGGSDVNQEKLISVLWLDADIDRKVFEITLHRLRKLFGTDAPLVLKNKELSLDVRLCWVDYWALQRLLSKLDTVASVSEIDTLLDQMFNLYQGPFLAYDEDLYCALQLQERLRSRLMRCVQRIAQLGEDAGRHDLAMRCYERLLEVEPGVEEGYRHLVRLYERQGRHADAKTCYHRCERVLRKLLGVSPSFALNTPGNDTGPRPRSLPAHRNTKHPPS